MDIGQLIVTLLQAGIGAFGVWVQNQLEQSWPAFAAQGYTVKRGVAYLSVVAATCALWWLGVYFDVFAAPESFKAFVQAVSPYVILSLTVNQGTHAAAKDAGRL